MIDQETYQAYLQNLLRGDATRCGEIVQALLDRPTPMLDLYSDLFRQSLYDVGALWESNRISVSVEHLATAITERLLAVAYPRLVADHDPSARPAVVSCGINEYHQLGARMVADVLEGSGWDVRFLGANTPEYDLLQIIDHERPKLVCLSVTMFFSMAPFIRMVEAVRHHYPNLEIVVGGQAFRWGGSDALQRSCRVAHLPDLRTLGAELAR